MKKKKSGFTLIELIITLTITVIVLGIANEMFITGNKVFSDSDVKSTLQIEGQAIQEKISNICMQATGVQGIERDETTNELNNLRINSYIYNSDGTPTPHTFAIRKEESTNKYKDGSRIYNLFIDNQLISSNIQGIDITTNNNDLSKVNFIEFNIKLKKEKGYSNVEQNVNFGITFRNK